MTKTSLYRHYSADEELLYIGISVSALSRLGQKAKVSELWEKVK